MKVGNSIVDEVVVGSADKLALGPLALQPQEGLLTADAVALHDALDAHVLGGGDDNDSVYEVVGSGLVEDGALHPRHAALLEVAEDGGVDNGVNLAGIGVAL